MSGRPKSVAVQLSELLKRIERIESRISGQGGDPYTGQGRGPDDDRDYSRTLNYCALPQVPPRVLGPEVSRDRARLIELIGKKWVNGTKLRYYFMENAPDAGGNDQKDIVREGFEVWRNVGIGIQFEEIRDISEAEVRIGFRRGDGSWSYIGRDVIDIPRQTERTMNFGWDLSRDPRREDVAVHEIGHTLGFPHEHQNPFAGIEWDEQAVYNYFASPPNSWDRDTTFYNILRKLPASDVQGTAWDPDSIMHYAFAAGLIRQPDRYRNGLTPAGGLSQHDIDQALVFYPRMDPASGDAELRVGQSQSLSLAPAEQRNFTIRPTATRTYTIQTIGQSDTVIVLFEDQNGDLKYVDGDDDSGTDLNSRLVVRLYQGRRYVLRIRLYSDFSTGGTSVILS